MLTQRPLQRGVSLVEIMIGLAIVAVLLAMGAPSFNDFLQNSRIRNAAEAIQNGLNLARAEAVRRNTNIEFVLGLGSAWTVRCETAVPDSDNDPDAEPDCPGSSPDATAPASIQARSAAEGSAGIAVTTSQVVAATNTAAATPVFATALSFNGMGRAVTLPPGNNAVFDIANTVGGDCVTAGGPMRCLRVVVSAGGQVRMCDPALTASNPSDPQAC